MRSLVTGGAGFIGSHVVDVLLALEHEVAVLDDFSGGFPENVNPYARLYQGSITDHALVDRIFADCKFDYVYHCAAYAAEGLSPFIRRFNYTNNLIGSVNLINASVRHHVKCFVFTSSIAVYGSGQIPFTEEMTPRPEDPYGISKYAVELDLAAAHYQFGLPYIIFRPHNVYGERQNIGDPYRNVVGIFMNQILKGEPCTIFGDGTQTRAFTHVTDVSLVIAGSVQCEKAYGQIFNVGTDLPCTINDLLHYVHIAMGRDTGVKYLPPRKEVIHAISASDKVVRVLGVVPQVALEEGLWRMASWVRRSSARISQPFRDIEITDGLPPSWRRDEVFASAGNR